MYIMASQRYGTLYIGVTNNLALRGHQFKRREREWKLALIEHSNREWADLYERLSA